MTNLKLSQWKKEEESFVSFAPPVVEEAPVVKEPSKPFVIPDPTILYKPDEKYQPYDNKFAKEVVTSPAPKQEEPLPDPPPSIDNTLAWYKGPEIKVDISEVEDPMLVAVVKELSKEDAAAKLSAKASAPKKKDPLVAAAAKVLTTKKKTAPKKVVAPPKKKVAPKKATKKPDGKRKPKK